MLQNLWGGGSYLVISRANQRGLRFEGQRFSTVPVSGSAWCRQRPRIDLGLEIYIYACNGLVKVCSKVPCGLGIFYAWGLPRIVRYRQLLFCVLKVPRPCHRLWVLIVDSIFFRGMLKEERLTTRCSFVVFLYVSCHFTPKALKCIHDVSL